jgi:hypothetical protein
MGVIIYLPKHSHFYRLDSMSVNLSAAEERRRGGLRLEMLSPADLETCKAVIQSVRGIKSSVFRRRARYLIAGHYGALMKSGGITEEECGRLIEQMD